MKIIAHRGIWSTIEEKNTIGAIKKAFNNNFGVEIDLRDYNGELVVSHDIPNHTCTLFEDVLQSLDGRNIKLAINIKADGLGDSLKAILNKYKISNYFTFDMSIPELIYQQNIELNTFTGLSEIVKEPILLDKSCGIWLDSFNTDWFNESDIQHYLNINKIVCIVSPELHGRPHKEIWAKYRYFDDVYICTDFPFEAEEYFNG